jgi:O-antigen/teichoic acid export membrane protein
LIKRKLIIGTSFNTLGLIAVMLIKFVLISYMIFILGLERFGLVALSQLFSILGFIALLDFGIPGSLTRQVSILYKSEKYSEISSLIWSCLVVFFFIGMFVSISFMLFIDIAISDLFKIGEKFKEQYKLALIVLFLSHIYQFPLLIIKAVYNGLAMFGTLQIVLVLTELISAITIIVLLYIGYDFDSVIIVNAIAPVSVIIFLIILLPKHLLAMKQKQRVVDSLNSIKELAKMIFIQRASATVYNNIDRLVVGIFLGPIGVASTEIFKRIPTLFNRALGLSISAIVPSISGMNVNNDRELLLDIYHNGFKIYYIIICPPLVFLINVAPEVLILWTGNFSEEIINCMRLMCFWCLFFPFQFGGHMLIGLNRRVGAFTAFIASQAIVKGLVVIIGIPLIGLYSIPLSYLATLVTFIYLLYILKTVIGISIKRLLYDGSLVLLSSIIPLVFYFYLYSHASIMNWSMLFLHFFIIYFIQLSLIYFIVLKSKEKYFIKYNISNVLKKYFKK